MYGELETEEHKNIRPKYVTTYLNLWVKISESVYFGLT